MIMHGHDHDMVKGIIPLVNRSLTGCNILATVTPELACDLMQVKGILATVETSF